LDQSGSLRLVSAQANSHGLLILLSLEDDRPDIVAGLGWGGCGWGTDDGKVLTKIILRQFFTLQIPAYIKKTGLIIEPKTDDHARQLPKAQ